MITKAELQKASEQGLIGSDQVDPLYQFLSKPSSLASVGAEPSADNRDEPLRFIRSFGDIFITLGIVLLVITVNMAQLSGTAYLIPVAGFLLISEWLVRVRKLALPGIAILLAILYLVNKAIDFDHERATTLGLAILSASSLLYYLRYRMPFSLLPLAAGLVAIVLVQTGSEVLARPVIIVGLGLAVFMVAMGFDVLDPKRRSHLSDSAFWLHLLASPLMVHGAMFSLLSSEQSWLRSLDAEFIIVLFFIVFFLLALLIDRRAMLISTQLYIIYAATQLLNNRLDDSQNILMYVMMGLGFFVLFFGSYWYLARRIIFGFLVGTALARYLPDLALRDTQK